MKYIPFYVFIFSGLVSIVGCLKEDIPTVVTPDMESIAIPTGFPQLSHPAGNSFTKERWVLGKSLFFDTSLSVDGTISCATCHNPTLAFADFHPTTPGVKNRAGTRNAPTLANVGYHPYYLREGGVPTLEMQVLVPVAEHNEFDFNLIKIVERLSINQRYQSMAMAAYGRPLDAFVITRAISLFERSLLSGNSNYDKYIHGNIAALNALEKEGMALFFSSRTNCSSCHNGFLFTNFAFANNGIYKEYSDPGRFRLTEKKEDMHLFKTPGLRNVGYTAPYMHDGSISTLEKVIDHYNSGGQNHPQQSPLIRPLGLSEREKQALAAFLRSLNDASFVSNPYFQK